MPKFLRPGKAVVLLNGRHAGKKAVIVKTQDEPSKTRPYGSATVIGISRYPRPIKRSMSKKRQAKYSKVRAFVKQINYNHIMPTRYGFEIKFDKINIDDAFHPDKKKTERKEIKKKIAALLEDRYKQGKNRWFFSKLKF